MRDLDIIRRALDNARRALEHLEEDYYDKKSAIEEEIDSLLWELYEAENSEDDNSEDSNEDQRL